MDHLQVNRRATAVATLVSAIIGSAQFVLLSLFWPRPIIAWMRVVVPDLIYPAPVEFGLRIAAVFVAVFLLLAVVVHCACWMFRRLKVSRPATSLAVALLSAFALAFAIEATSQVARAWGNLTASDATGLIIDGGQLTLHGWETIARRAAVASLYTGIMAGAFGVARLVVISRGRFP